MTLRVAVAGVPGAWSSERMAAALQDHGIDSFVFSLADCLHNLSAQSVTLNGTGLGRLDGIVVKKLGEDPSARSSLRLHMLRELQGQGVRIFSPPSVIERVMDRYRMTMTLVRHGLPIPATYAVESESTLREAATRLGSTVAKPVFTSKGRGFLRFEGATASHENALDGTAGPMLAQRFVTSPGRDIGACVLGGRFAGAFYRVAAEGQWLTTTAAGGTYAPCKLPPKGVALAEDAACAFDLDYTVVDLVETDAGYLTYEVSAFGGFRGLWEAYRVDVAQHYAEYIKHDLLA